MKSYHSISKEINYNIPIIAFDKMDGSNIRAEINIKKGFYKFGSRKSMLPSDSNILNESIELIKNNYEEQLVKIFEKRKYLSTVCYFEFYGKSSKFGQHILETHLTTLFDIDVYKRGFVKPNQFVDEYGHLNIPKIIYKGYLTNDIINNIKNDITLSEGIVGKSDILDKNQKPIMFKIKTYKWLSELKEYCKGDIKLFNELE